MLPLGYSCMIHAEYWYHPHILMGSLVTSICIKDIVQVPFSFKNDSAVRYSAVSVCLFSQEMRTCKLEASLRLIFIWYERARQGKGGRSPSLQRRSKEQTAALSTLLLLPTFFSSFFFFLSLLHLFCCYC